MELKDPLIAFLEAAAVKDRDGLIEHRGGDEDAPFLGDLCTEYEEEQLDSFNYLRRMYDNGIIKDDEYNRSMMLHMECWFWMRTNVRER